jgi:hypothetical protein
MGLGYGKTLETVSQGVADRDDPVGSPAPTGWSYVDTQGRIALWFRGFVGDVDPVLFDSGLKFA